MSSIDDRVVNMQFNNDQFQKGISDTTNSLDQLKTGLKLDGATAGIDQVQGAANRFSLANMENALQNISSKFSIFGVVGFTVLQDLTNMALDAGKGIAAALIDPLVNGGQKRAAALQQANFQFRGLGLDIEATMAAALAAVKGTAFGLDDAALAAGQLGASGIIAGAGLEEALRGISGVAAQTGSSYADVARVFQNVAGNGRLMGQDLLSLSSRGVNAAATLAKSMGITESAVRDMVSEGQISFDQFSTAMNEAFGPNAAKANELYSGALSNMNAALARIGAAVAGTKLIALRDIFNALGPLFDEVLKAIQPLINAFNDMQMAASGSAVQTITETLGPRLIDALKNIVIWVLKISKALSGGFQRIFPDNTAQTMNSIGQFLKKITEAMIPGAEAAAKLERTFAGVFAIFSILGQIIGAVVGSFIDLFGFAASGTGSFLTITARIGDFIVALDAALKSSNVFQTFFQGIASILAGPIAAIKLLIGIIADGVTAMGSLDAGSFNTFADDVAARFAGLSELGEFFGKFWGGIVDGVRNAYNFLAPIFTAIGDALSGAVKNVKDSFSQLSFSDGNAIVNTGIFAALTLMINGFFGNLGNIIGGNNLAFVQQFKIIFGALTTNLKALEMNTNAKTLTQIAIAVALLAASAVALSFVDSGKLTVALAAMAGMVTTLLVAFDAFSKMQTTMGMFEMMAMVGAITGIAIAILILAGAIAILGAIPTLNLIQGVLALAAVMAILVGTMKLLANTAPQVLLGALAISVLAPAIILLAAAIAIMGAIPFLNLLQGVGAFVAIMGILVGSFALLNLLGPRIILGAAAIALIIPPIVLLVGAIALMGALPFANLLQGTVAFAAILLVLAGVILLLGLVAPQALLGAVAIGLVALSLVPLIGAVALLGAIPIDNLVAGVLALAAVMVILVGAVLLLGFSGGAGIIGATAIIMLAIALGILAPALVILGSLSWDEIGRGMALLASAIGILAIGGILLIPASVGFLLLGLAILLIGSGISMAAAGVALLAVGIGALMLVGSAGIALFIAGIKAFIEQLPAFGAGIGAAIVSMAQVIGTEAPKLVEAFVNILIAMLDAIILVVPKIIETATIIIVSLVEALVVLIPLLVSAGLKIIVGILTGIRDNIEKITTLAIEIVAKFIDGIANGLPKLIQSGINLIISFVNGLADGIRNNTAKMNSAGNNLASAIIDGMTSGIRNAAQNVINAITGVANNAVNAAKRLLGIKSPSTVFNKEIGQQISLGMAQGITSMSSNVSSAAEDVGKTAIDTVKDSVSGISDALSSNIDMTPTIRPVLDLTAIQSGAKAISGLIPAPSLSLGTSNNVATSVSLQEQAQNAQMMLDASLIPNAQSQLTFIQNNTSPKALSTSEVYRQTQNQLSTLKGELGVVN